LEKIAGVADCNFHFKWEFTTQMSEELCARSRFSNNESSGGADVYNIIGREFFCEHAGTKCAVSADVDSSEEND